MPNKKIFLAAPISGFHESNEYESFRVVMTNLISYLRGKGHSVYSEIETVYDETCYDSPAKSATDDFLRISDCDTFLMLHPKRMQTSTFIELGYACALRKKLIIVGKNEDLPYLARGLKEAENHACIINPDKLDEDVFKQISDALVC